MWKRPSLPDRDDPGPTGSLTKTVCFVGQLFCELPLAGLIFSVRLCVPFLVCHPFAVRGSIFGNIDLLFRFYVIVRVRISAAAMLLLSFCFCRPAAGVTPIVVNGKGYVLSTLLDSYNASWRKFQLPENGGVMPWWGSASLASRFAAAAFPFYGGGVGSAMRFAYQVDDVEVTWRVAQSDPPQDFTFLRNERWIYVTADRAPGYDQPFTPPAAAVPTPLALPAALVAMGWARRLRSQLRKR
jgi:hypothetical protein